MVVWTGTPSWMMGELAEQWTASDLRKLWRDGWPLVNQFSRRLTTWTICSWGRPGIIVVEPKRSGGNWSDQ
jgi:hypothetical protein